MSACDDIEGGCRRRARLRRDSGAIVGRHASVFGVPDLRAFYWHFAREGRAAWPERAISASMRLPMNALLSQALVTVTHEYEQRGAGSVGLPTLAVWSNVLRPVGDGIDLRELPAAARLSKRAVRAAVGAAVREGGWSATETPCGHRHPASRLASGGSRSTPTSRRPSPATPPHHCARWFASFTSSGRTTRPATVQPTTRSPGASTCRVAVRATRRCQRMEWTGRRSPGTTLGGRASLAWPLSALLSEAFVAFAADFEELGIGGLHLAASVLRLLPDGGVPVSDIAMLSRLKGDGKSVLERHGYIEIWRDAGKPKVPLAVPTARGRNTRDKYEGTVRRVEDRWRLKYGADVVARLRSALESVDIDRSLPHSVIDTLT